MQVRRRYVGLIPGLGRSPGRGNGTHSSFLAWRIPRTEEPGRLQSIGLHRVRHNWSNLAHSIYIFIYILFKNIIFHYGLLQNIEYSSLCYIVRTCCYSLYWKGLFIFFYLSFGWAVWLVRSFSSVQFSRSVMSNSLRPHELQHTRPPCPSPTPGVHPNPCPSVSDAIQPSHPLSSFSPPALNPSQHQSLFQWVNSSHEVAKVLEFQL